MCMWCILIMYIEIHPCMYAFKTKYVMFILNYMNKNIYMQIYIEILSKYILYVCVFVIIHILCKQNILFWMRLIV